METSLDMCGSHPPSVWAAAKDMHPTFLSCVPESNNHFPTLAELNQEIDKEMSDSIEHSPSQNPHVTDNVNSEVLTISVNIGRTETGPLCLANTPQNPEKSFTFDLNTTMINVLPSQDELLFISHAPPNHDRREWKLVQMDWECTLLRAQSSSN